MKKIFCLVAFVAAMFAFSACGNRNAEVLDADCTDSVMVDSVMVDTLANDTVCVK